MNKHGLRRHIPADVRRQVIQNSRNGCVVCRGLICEFEHIDPEFADALQHSPDDICLLCRECHGQVTKRLLSKKLIRKKYEEVRNSASERPPFFQATLEGKLTIRFGGARFLHCPPGCSIISYAGNPVLYARYVPDPIYGGSRPSITGSITDQHGDRLLQIEDNLLTFCADGVTIYTEANVVEVRDLADKVVFRLTIEENRCFAFDRLFMRVGEMIIDAYKYFGVIVPTCGNRYIHYRTAVMVAAGAETIIAYEPNRSNWNGDEEVFGANIGLLLPKCGATIAAGAPAVARSPFVYAYVGEQR